MPTGCALLVLAFFNSAAAAPAAAEGLPEALARAYQTNPQLNA